MARTLAHCSVDNCVILVHSDCAPDDDEFLTYLERCNAVAQDLPPGSIPGALIHTEGPGPTAKQRALITERLQGRAKNTRAAILTVSPVARGIVTALNWLGHPQKAFTPTDLKGAFAFIDAPGMQHHDAARRAVVKLRTELAGHPTRTAFTDDQYLMMRLASLRDLQQARA